MGRRVFADSSAIIARFLEKDPYHASAEREARRLLRAGARFVTTNYIFAEVVTRVRRLADHHEARRVGDALLASVLFIRIHISEELEIAAWRLHAKYGDHAFSFTDVTCLAVMQAYGIEEIFTFDEEFGKVGVIRLPRLA